MGKLIAAIVYILLALGIGCYVTAPSVAAHIIALAGAYHA